MSYSDKQLITLAQNNPKELTQLLISPNTNVTMLASGAEILGGEVSDEEIVLPVLRLLIKHRNAVVREGAILGLSSFYLNRKIPTDILEKLKTMSLNDPSVVIKDTIKSLLNDFE